MAENDLRAVSLARVTEAVRSYGMQKQLARDLNMTDTEVSRLLHDQAPKVIALLSALNLEVVEFGHVEALRKVLKEVL